MYVIQDTTKSHIKVIVTSYHTNINTNILLDINYLSPILYSHKTLSFTDSLC